MGRPTTSIDYHSPRFKSSDVARAAGVPLNSFRTYFKRGQFRMVGQTDAPAGSHGLPHLFALRDAMGFAIAAELIRAGVDAADAWQIGMWSYAHTADEGRNPGELFDHADHGFTYLLTWPGIQSGRVVSGKELDDPNRAHPVVLLTPPGQPRQRTFRLTLVNAIERAVFAVLGLNA